MSKENQPEIVTYIMQQDEFYFLGIETKIIEPIEDMNFENIWNNFFEAGGFEKIASYQTDSYANMVIYHDNNPEHEMIYFIGSIVENINEVPNGYRLMKFSEHEFLVITHEWLPTKNEALGQIFRIGDYAETITIPNGYIRSEKQITLIERENMDTEDGSRFEVWVPIERRTSWHLFKEQK